MFLYIYFMFLYVFLFVASCHTFSCCLPVTTGRCPPGCPSPPCPQCPGYSAAWPRTLGRLCCRTSWSRVSRWRWWRPESAQETDPEPVQQPTPRTGRSTETEPLHRLRQNTGDRPASLTDGLTNYKNLRKCHQNVHTDFNWEPISSSSGSYYI